jgi:integrase
VDLQRSEISVENTKSGMNRMVPINPELNALFLRQKKQDKIMDLVFPNPKTGRPFTEVKKSFKSACRKTGIDGLRFHDLRHTFATRLLEMGVDIITVRDLLGHFSIRVTQRYTHSNRDRKKEAVKLLNRTEPKAAENLNKLSHGGGVCQFTAF